MDIYTPKSPTLWVAEKMVDFRGDYCLALRIAGCKVPKSGAVEYRVSLGEFDPVDPASRNNGHKLLHLPPKSLNPAEETVAQAPPEKPIVRYAEGCEIKPESYSPYARTAFAPLPEGLTLASIGTQEYDALGEYRPFFYLIIDSKLEKLAQTPTVLKSEGGSFRFWSFDRNEFIN